MAGIQRRVRKDGTESYRVNWWADGKVNWSPTLTSAEGAVQLKEMIERIGPDAAMSVLESRAGNVQASMPLLRDYLEVHLRRVASHAAEATEDEYRREAARTWLPRLGDFPLDALSRDHVTGWITWQRQQETVRSKQRRARAEREGQPVPEPETYAPKSVRNAHALLSAVLASAVEDSLIPKNVAKGLRLPSDHARSSRVFLLPDEFTAIYHHIPERYKPLVATAYGTGMRWGELTGLMVGGVQIEGDRAASTVRQAWKKGGKLGGPKSVAALRTVVVTGPLVDVLADQIAGRPATSLVFTNSRGGRVWEQSFRPRVWNKAVAASGVDKRPDFHSLRHSHASNLIRAGIPLTMVQRRLGHEDISTTSNVYGHLAPDTHVAAAEAAALSMVGALPQIES